MTGVDFVLQTRGQAPGRPDAPYEYRVWPLLPHPAVSYLQRIWRFVAAERRADIYLLGRRRDRVLVKLRGGQRLEIKRRLRNLGTVQYWAMPVSTAFPLGSGHRMALAEALGLVNGIGAEAALSPAHLLSAVGVDAPDIVSQTVRKSRLLFESGGCRAEICRVAVGGWTGLTLALDAAALAPIVLAMDDLRLGTLPNRSYAEVLGRLVGLQPAPPRMLVHIQTHEIRHP